MSYLCKNGDLNILCDKADVNDCTTEWLSDNPRFSNTSTEAPLITC